MSAIALTSPDAALDTGNIRLAHTVLPSKNVLRFIGRNNFLNLLIGKPSIPMFQSKGKSVLIGCVGEIFSACPKKQMVWIKAFRIIALVADEKIVGYFSVRKFVHKAMGSPLNPVHIHKTIPIASARSGPFPTPVLGNLSLFHKSLHWRPNTGFISALNSLSPVRHVMIAAHAATYNGFFAMLALGHSFAPYDDSEYMPVTAACK